jgi:diketogulonate reductase-like aldo/keto reductase
MGSRYSYHHHSSSVEKSKCRRHSCKEEAHALDLYPKARPHLMQLREAVEAWVRHRLLGDEYSPMQSGLLTDTFSRERVEKFSEDDWRRRSPDFQEPKLSRNLALRDALRPIAQRHGTTVSAVAVAWVIAWPGITGAIVGGRSPQQVDDWIGAATLNLTSADLQQIADAIVRTGAGSGPTVPQLQKAA